MSTRFDWKQKLTNRETFIFWASILIGMIAGAGVTGLLYYFLVVF